MNVYSKYVLIFLCSVTDSSIYRSETNEEYFSYVAYMEPIWYVDTMLLNYWNVLYDVIRRVRLAVHKETSECVAVKIIHVNDLEEGDGGPTQECLKKEVSKCINCN